jgi:3D (Asp-Asp-Asp) domain-containing protein
MLKKIILFTISLILVGGCFFFCLAKESEVPNLWTSSQNTLNEDSFLIIQGNSILPISSLPEIKVVRQMKVITTAYSSCEWQTDDTPYITAAGTRVRDGIVANNLLAFGTKIRLPEIYGDKIFVVEDRMHSRKGSYHVDIWFASYNEALNYGAQKTYIEVLEN